LYAVTLEALSWFEGGWWKDEVPVWPFAAGTRKSKPVVQDDCSWRTTMMRLQSEFQRSLHHVLQRVLLCYTELLMFCRPQACFGIHRLSALSGLQRACVLHSA